MQIKIGEIYVVHVLMCKCMCISSHVPVFQVFGIFGANSLERKMEGAGDDKLANQEGGPGNIGLKSYFNDLM